MPRTRPGYGRPVRLGPHRRFGHGSIIHPSQSARLPRRRALFDEDLRQRGDRRVLSSPPTTLRHVQPDQPEEAAAQYRRPRYAVTGTVARSTLVSRGWTSTHLKRLLGDPDIPEAEGQSPRYDRARVEAAESNDEVLQKRLARGDNRRTARKERQISQRVATGVTVWRRRDGRWVLFGKDLHEGQLVTATRRGGRTERKRITHVLEVTPDGVYAEAPGTPKPQRRPHRSAARQVMLVGRHAPGTILDVDGDRVELLVVRHVVITAEDPARWGAHLTYHIGQIATRATCHTIKNPAN